MAFDKSVDALICNTHRFCRNPSDSAIPQFAIPTNISEYRHTNSSNFFKF